ncbi:hypothetical protein [Mesorhizobium erdmanii]|uniref:DUF707 domain-containing protein n=1 Tax=Mesorhizobium erdmanii TaxID=1777866 RepID=A0A6M7UN78_9HYPH|nr:MULTISPECIES: hypothetical protein [Mesorhizobium]OBQ61139.1 hypothetical protein A8146_17030 [Mesorhizobium loti]QKC77623.1 hypothetical protein EB233_20715 [Mesorhizobium erdmanii]
MTVVDQGINADSGPMTNAARRNLVVVRADDNSLHRGWGADDPQCEFDLIVSYYGSGPSAFRLPCENRVDYKGGKWDGIHALFAERPELLDHYRYIWFPDDDIEADRATIEALFVNMRRFDLHVGQPALTLDSYYTHLPFLRCKSFECRLVDKIEVMAPCIRTDIVAKMLPLFEHSMGGFGLDSLWTRLAVRNLGTSAVFDALPVRHTRPVGVHLATTMLGSGHTAESELRRLGLRYGFGEFFPLSYEAVDLKGRRWRSRPIIGLRMVADYVQGRRAFRQVHKWKRRLWHLLRRQYSKPVELSQIKL